MALQVGETLPRVVMKVYEPFPQRYTRHTLKSLLVRPPEKETRPYTMPYADLSLPHIVAIVEGRDVKIGEVKVIDFTKSPVTKRDYYQQLGAYEFLYLQTVEENRLKQESLSILKPEVVGLSLGSAVSLVLGILALATGNLGAATVMAGPFLASMLGFVLLLMGAKRYKK